MYHKTAPLKIQLVLQKNKLCTAIFVNRMQRGITEKKCLVNNVQTRLVIKGLIRLKSLLCNKVWLLNVAGLVKLYFLHYSYYYVLVVHVLYGQQAYNKLYKSIIQVNIKTSVI